MHLSADRHNPRPTNQCLIHLCARASLHSLSLKLDTSAVVVKKIFGAKVAINSKTSDGVGCPSGSTVWRGVVLAVHPVDRPVLEHAFAATTASTVRVRVRVRLRLRVRG